MADVVAQLPRWPPVILNYWYVLVSFSPIFNRTDPCNQQDIAEMIV